MVVLSYGFKQPENGDKGSVWFPALNFNITQLNNHAHNGVDSALVNQSNVVGASVSVPSGSWTADGTGRWKQTVNVPAGYNMTDFSIKFLITSSGLQIYPTIEKVNTTSFTVYTNDNSLTYSAVFR